MKNKTQNMYGKLAAILLTVVLLTAGLSCTALAAGENLIASFAKYDPGFEAELPQNDPWIWTNGTAAISVGGHGGNGANSTEGHSMKLPAVGDSISFFAPVEPAKNYNLSFWMKNSKEGALQLIGANGASAFFAPAGTYNNVKRQNYHLLHNVDYLGKENTAETRLDWKIPHYTYLGVGAPTCYDESKYTFGIAREGAAADAWRQVTINFTTPVEVVGYVKFTLAAAGEADSVLAVDDLSVVETGQKPSFIYNGNLEAFRNDGDAPALTDVTYVTGDNYNTNIVTENGNTYLTAKFTGTNKNNRTNWQIESRTALQTKGKRLGTRYVISYKAKAADTDKAAIGHNVIELRDPNNRNNQREYIFGQLTKDWKTYTMYVDATRLAAKDAYIKDFYTWFARYAYNTYTLCLDDLYAWYDEAGIGFYDSLDLMYDTDTSDSDTETDRAFDYVKNYTGDEYKNMIMLESGNEVAKISELPENENGSRTVTVRAHYLPKATWGEWDAEKLQYPATFNPTTVTLLSSVYKYEKDANGNETKTLVNVKIASGTSGANGETIDVVGEITVPKAVGNERYEVEAIALDMNTLKPIAEKAILK